MYNRGILEMDITELPITVKLHVRNNKSKYYMLKNSGDGAQLCGIEKPLEQLLRDKYDN